MLVRRAGVAALLLAACIGAAPAAPTWAGSVRQPAGVPGAAATTTPAATDRLGQIHGTVRDDTGAPVAGATVALLGCAPDCPGIAITNAAGEYYLFAVPAAPRLGVMAWRGSDLMRQWYPLADSPADALRFPLAAGEVRGPVDFALTRGAYLTVEVQGTRRDQPLRAVVHLIGPRDTHHQYIAHDPVGTLEDDPAAGGPAAPVRLRVGPVPPGQYAVRVTRGLPEIGKLPDRWVTRTPAAPRPTVELTSGWESTTSAALSGPGSATGAGSGAGRQAGPAWPGLATGFLSPLGRAILLGGTSGPGPSSGSHLMLIPPRGNLGA